MTEEQLIQEVKRVIYAELRGTIPPSIDIMRDLRFESAAKKAVEICKTHLKA